MCYTHVQFIGHCIYTAFNNVWEGEGWKEEYNGDLDQGKDIEAKVEVVKQAIKLAREEVQKLARGQKTPEQKILKIFMLPEMFFQARAGAYEPQYSEILVKKLQTLIQHKDWEDWIFVFGTIVKLTEATTTNNKNSIREVSNFTLVQKGGFQEQNPNDYQYIVPKIKSSSEFIKSDKLTQKLRGENPVVTGDEGKYRFAQAENLLSSFTFELLEENKQFKIKKTDTSQQKGKIVFGLETCADHGEGRIYEKLQEAQKKLGIVDIQLVPSAGTAILRDKIVVRNDGYVFNCDGWNTAGVMRDTKKEPPALNVVEFNQSGKRLSFSPHSEVLKVCLPTKLSIDIKTTEQKNLAPFKVQDSKQDESTLKSQQQKANNTSERTSIKRAFDERISKRTYIQIKGKVATPIEELIDFSNSKLEFLYISYIPESLLQKLLPDLTTLSFKDCIKQESRFSPENLKNVASKTNIEVEFELVYRVFLTETEVNKAKIEANRLCESFQKELEERIKKEKVSISLKPTEHEVTLSSNKSFPKGLGKLHVYPVQPLPI